MHDSTTNHSSKRSIEASSSGLVSRNRETGGESRRQGVGDALEALIDALIARERGGRVQALEAHRGARAVRALWI